MSISPFIQKGPVGSSTGPSLPQPDYSDPEMVHKLLERAQVVCQITLERGGGGTGFLIGENLIMTNHHVLPTVEVAREAHAVFFHTLTSQKRIEVSVDPDHFFQCSPTPDQLGFKSIDNSQLDFTIVSIKPDPKIREVAHLAFSIFRFTEPKIGGSAHIAQHPLKNNPSGIQKVAFQNNSINWCDQYTVHYATVTESGSSGAPVMDDEGSLIAMHRAACTDLLKTLLREEILEALLKELFPRNKFSKDTRSMKDPQGNVLSFRSKSTIVEGSALHIFYEEGEMQGKYLHGAIKSPASLFELIKVQHNPPKKWALEFLERQGSSVADYHRECNTAVRMGPICQYLQGAKYLGDIKKRYDATQKTLSLCLKDSYILHLAELPSIVNNQGHSRAFFGQLAIVSAASQQKKEDKAKNTYPLDNDSHRGIYEQLHTPEQLLNIGSLFENQNGKPVTKVLVVGDVGSGKSTLCQKIAYDWSVGALFQGKFSTVYYLQLLKLNSWFRKAKNQLRNYQDPDAWLSNVISSLCYQGMYQTRIYQELQSNFENTLVILDGWDEASSALGENFRDWLRLTRIKNYLLTSRPGTTLHIEANFDLVLENMGFTQEQLKIYTEKLFAHTIHQESNAFLNHLYSHHDLLKLARIPLQLQILSVLWQKEGAKLPQNLSVVLSKITEKLFEWTQRKRKEAGQKEIPRSKKFVLYEALGVIALQGLESGRFMISSELALKNKKFDKIDTKALIGTGFVRGCIGNGEIYFTEPIYQEYSVAKLISDCSEKQQQDFVMRYRFKPQFQPIFRLLAGCIWENTHRDIKALEKFIGWIYGNPVGIESSEQELSFHDPDEENSFDLIGSYPLQLILSCLKECSSSQLEEIIWRKYKITDFVDYVSSFETTIDCLVRLMALSNRACEQVVKKLKKEGTNVRKFFDCLTTCVLEKKHFRDPIAWLESIFYKDFPEVFGKPTTSIEEVAPALLRILTSRPLNPVKDSIFSILSHFKIILEDAEPRVRMSLAKIFGEIAQHLGPSYTHLLLSLFKTLLEDKDSSIRQIASQALVPVAIHAQKSLHVFHFCDYLQTLLKDRTPHLLGNVIKSIGHLKAIGDRDLRAICKCLQTTLIIAMPVVRRSSFGAQREGTNPYQMLVNCLKIAIKDPEPNTRTYAFEIFGAMAVHVEKGYVIEILHDLPNALRDPNSKVRAAVLESLQQVIETQIGSIGNMYIILITECLEGSLKDQEPSICKHAAELLKKIAKYRGKGYTPPIVEDGAAIANDQKLKAHIAAIEAFLESKEGLNESNALLILDHLQIVLSSEDSEAHNKAFRAIQILPISVSISALISEGASNALASLIFQDFANQFISLHLIKKNRHEWCIEAGGIEYARLNQEQKDLLVAKCKSFIPKSWQWQKNLSQ
jgi:hypothetical protein